MSHYAQMKATTLLEIVAGNLHPMLKKVLVQAVNLWPEETVRFTSLNRSREEDRRLGASGIHSAGPPWRALDIGGRFVEQEQINEVAAVLNDIWEYDHTRPHLKVAVANQHGTGRHLHLQVHDNTGRRPQV